MAKTPLWDPEFTPYYTPVEMLEMGVFEGKYINAVKGLPKSWYQIKKVLPKDAAPDPSLNYYGVKSRLPLSHWKEKGWTTKDSPWGWCGWYCLYWLGRRLPEEDAWQIGRWKSFIARHQGQIVASGDLKDETKRLKQRQALLQWGWKSTLPFNEANKAAARKRLLKHTEVSMESRVDDWFLW